MKPNLLSVLSFVKLYKCILQRISRPFVADYLTTHDGPEPRKNELEVRVSGDWIQFAYKQDVFGRANVRKWQVANHFEGQRRCCCCFFPTFALLLLLRQSGKSIFIFGDPCGVIRRPGRRRGWLDETSRVRKWVVYGSRN